jgi:hypothetical protein
MVDLVWSPAGLPIPTVFLASSARRIGAFGLVTPPFTIAYQSPNLGLGLPRETFTNLYHRDGGQGIELSIVAGNQHQATGWRWLCRVITV